MTQIQAPFGATKAKKIVGRGASSSGRRCGRGNNGQNARSGGGVRPGFEGGQMPLYRKVARRGFSNYPFKKEYSAVSLLDIDRVFSDGDEVSDSSLRDKGLLKGRDEQAKILSCDTFTKKVTINGVKMSKKAEEMVKAAGGQVKEAAN